MGLHMFMISKFNLRCLTEIKGHGFPSWRATSFNLQIRLCLRKHSLVPSPRLWEVYLTEVNHCIIIIKCTRAISVLFVFHSLPLLEWRMTCSLKLQIYRTTKRIGKPLNQRLLWKNKSCHLCRPANPWSSFWQCPK